MARSRKRDDGVAAPAQLAPAAIDALLGDRQTMAELDELFRQMKQVIYERAWAAKLTHQLNYEKCAPRPEEQANHRSDTTPEAVLTEGGAIPLAILRNRAGTFAPQIITKHARWRPKFDEHEFSLCAHGTTMPKIQERSGELYQVATMPGCTSAVTDRNVAPHRAASTL